MPTNFERVKEFHRTFGLPVLTKPQWPSAQAIERRGNLITEEKREYDEAIVAGDLVAVADAITDLLYVAYGTAAEYGIDADACFAEVHDSNMSKLGADGKPIHRPSDGKVLKGPFFREPDLATVLANQS